MDRKPAGDPLPPWLVDVLWISILSQPLFLLAMWWLGADMSCSWGGCSLANPMGFF